MLRRRSRRRITNDSHDCTLASITATITCLSNDYHRIAKTALDDMGMGIIGKGDDHGGRGRILGNTLMVMLTERKGRAHEARG